jgi:hypothetical protein
MDWTRMPPTAINEHSDTPPRQDNVRRTTKGQLAVKTESGTLGMEGTAKQQFRSSIYLPPPCEMTACASGNPDLSGHLDSFRAIRLAGHQTVFNRLILPTIH